MGRDYLWHLVCLDKVLLMASTVGGQFRRVVLSHLCFEGKAWSRRDSLHFQKKKKSQSGKEMNREMRKQSSRRQQNDRACHIFFFFCLFVHKEDLSIQNQNCFAQEESWEGLNTPLVSASVQIFLQLALQKYQEKKFTFYTAFPLRSTDK